MEGLSKHGNTVRKLQYGLFLAFLLALHIEPARGGLDLFEPEDPLTYGNSHALIIAASQYNNGWSPLPGVKEDATALQTTLKEAGFQITLIEKTDSVALKEGIANFIQLYGNNSANRLVVYYSGHGETLKINNLKVGYIVPTDAPLWQTEGEQSFISKAIAMTYFTELAEQAQARHILFVFDSCFSGSIFSTMRSSGNRPSNINYLVNRPVRQFISSGSADQQVPDISIFRRAFQAALQGDADLNHDGYIIGTELGLYLRSNVANASNASQTPQFSRLAGENFQDGDFVFKSPIEAISPPDLHQSISPPSKDKDYAIGDVFAECENCPAMVVIPGSDNTTLGSPQDEQGHTELEVQRVLSIERFALSQYEVTYQQWQHCFAAGGCSRWIAPPAGLTSAHPVAGVSYREALEYTDWLSAKSGERYTLPTPDQWEYAARAGSPYARPWGNAISRGLSNCRNCGTPWSGKSTAPAGALPANRFGLHDMLGNVWEWVAQACNIKNHSDCSLAPIKGGSYNSTDVAIRSAATSFYPTDRAQNNFGFRVHRALKQ